MTNIPLLSEVVAHDGLRGGGEGADLAAIFFLLFKTFFFEPKGNTNNKQTKTHAF